MDDAIEYTLLNKKECLLYTIPPATAKGHMADDWKECVWRGRLLITGKGNDLYIKFVHASGDNMGKSLVEVKIDDGECDQFVERTLDSSRYFAIKVVQDQKKTFVGLGFEDRNDAFDFNCCLQDFKNRNMVEKAEPVATKDFSLKEGQKITVKLKGLKTKKKEPTQAVSGLGGGFLPPPPGNSRKQESSGGAVSSAFPSPATSATTAADDDDFFGGGGFSGFQSAAPIVPATTAAPASNGMNSGFAPAAPLVGTAVNVGQPTAPLTGVPVATPVQLPPTTTQNNDLFGDFDFGTPAAKPAAPAPPIQAYAVNTTATPAKDLDPFSQFNFAAPPAQPTPLTATNVNTNAPPAQKSNPLNGTDPFDIFNL